MRPEKNFANRGDEAAVPSPAVPGHLLNLAAPALAGEMIKRQSGVAEAADWFTTD